MIETTIVVPCYNESERLDVREFRHFLGKHDWVHFLFVNDGSSDSTLSVLDSLERGFEQRVGLLNLEQNVGKAEAVRFGMLAALETIPDGSYTGYWDADLATPLEAICDFSRSLAKNPNLTLVLGSRVSLLGRQIERKPSRHFLGRMFATTASLVLGLPIYDTQCGAKLFRVGPAVRTIFATPFRSRWIFDVELIARIIAESLENNLLDPHHVIEEMPLQEWTDVAGSKLKSLDFLKAGFELARISRTYPKYKRRIREALPEEPINPATLPFPTNLATPTSPPTVSQTNTKAA